MRMKNRTMTIILFFTLCIIFFALNCDLYFPPASFDGPVGEPTAAPTPWPAPTLLPTPTIPPNGNLIYNHDFSDGLDSWTFWYHDSIGVDASVQAISEEAVITIINSGDQHWHIQFQQKYLTIVQQRNYRVSFDARVTSQRPIYVEVGEDGYDNNGDGNKYTAYGAENIDIPATASLESYEMEFTMNYITDSQARLVFNLGAYPQGVWIDNVILEEIP